MKKGLIIILPFVCGSWVLAQDTPKTPAVADEKPAAAQQVKQDVQKIQPVFENEQINKLVKKYRKASAEEKPLIRQELYEIVSESMDLGLSSMKARIAQQKANLAHWEAKLAESEARWDELKAQRVEDLLSGAAERKYKLAQKAWKQEMKDQKQNMR